MGRLGSIFLFFAGFVFMAQSVSYGAVNDAATAEPDELVPPTVALVSPTGATLGVHQRVPARTVGGKSVVQFVLPANAANLQMVVGGQTIARWSTTPVLLADGNPHAGRRAQVEKEQVELNAKLMTINSRLALWQAPPKSGSPQDMSQMQAEMQNEMPGLVLEQAELERRLRLVNEELSRMPRQSGLGERVRVVLANEVPAGSMLDISYTYNHDGCGWTAVYDFNARPAEGSGDKIDVRLLAEVWQFTGMDWRDTAITLATRGPGPRQPAPLPEWIIDSASAPRPQPRAVLRNAKAAVALSADAGVRPEAAPVVANTDAVYATWQLTERGLPQGRSRLQILDATWQAPLGWLARPGRGYNQVWMYAKCNLPQGQAWPAGLAEYSVNGQNVGSGDFDPRGGEATLYFGADPAVSVTTTTDTNKRGESGFINTSKTWTWAWTYTISNQHNKPVRVKVERPAPVVVDQDVTITFKNDPKAQEDPKQHMLYWLVDVPAHGKKEIEHSVTLSSPTKLPLLPDVP